MRATRVSAVVGIVVAAGLALAACAGGPTDTVDNSPASKLQARLDAANPKGAQSVSYGGELPPGEASTPASSGSGVPVGNLTLTLACRGAETLRFRITLPGADEATYSVDCGTDQHLPLTSTQAGSIGFGVTADAAKHPSILYYAGFLHTAGAS